MSAFVNFIIYKKMTFSNSHTHANSVSHKKGLKYIFSSIYNMNSQQLLAKQLYRFIFTVHLFQFKVECTETGIRKFKMAF